MSADLKGLLLTQYYIFDWIAKFIVNYKKLSKTHVTYDHTKKRLDDLKKQWAEARRLRIDIDIEATEENRRTISYFVQDHFSTAEDAYYEALDFLIDELGKFKNAGIPVHEDSPDSSSFEATKLLSSRLPRINLPKFSGEFSEWESFRNTFEALIGFNNKITHTLKLYYLKSCVSDAAAKLINNLSVSEDNYPSAWKILMYEYEDKRALIRTHITSILRFPPMKMENVVELKRLRDTVANARAALANLGSPVEHWDQIIVRIMETKFSPETAREWDKSLGKSREFASYQQIYEFLTIYARGCSDKTSAKDAVEVKARGKSRPLVNSVSVPSCVNCTGSHNLAACDDFLSKPIAQRGALVKMKQVCFNCLRSGHFASKCQSRSRCTHCRRKHHSLLHSAATTAPMSIDQAIKRDQALEVDNSSQTFSTASSTTVANVQNAQAQVAPVQVLLVTA